MKEFNVNDYLTLKLEEGQTVIYVKGKRFRQCKFLLLEIPIKEITPLDEIESIDEAKEKLDSSLEGSKGQHREITPETEFWGHCSNLHAWYEHDYDTRLLHSNLAFPLLKRLTEAGDPLANKVFKEEIGKRITRGYLPVIKYLLEEGFLDYFTEEEFEFLFHGLEFVKYNGKKIPIIQDKLYLRGKGIKDFSEIIGLNKLKSLQYLNLWNNQLTELPEAIGNLTSLQHLSLNENQLTELPESIGNLSSLQELYLGSNKLKQLPESIGNLSSLQILQLNGNKLAKLPVTIKNLTSLQHLNLGRNKFIKIPVAIGNLSSLQMLQLSRNELIELPESIVNLTSLQYLNLDENQFTKLPEEINNLTSLQTLSLKDNPLINDPDSKIKDMIDTLKNNGIKVIAK